MARYAVGLRNSVRSMEGAVGVDTLPSIAPAGVRSATIDTVASSRKRFNAIMSKSFIRLEKFKNLLQQKPENWRELASQSKRLYSSFEEQLRKVDASIPLTDFQQYADLYDMAVSAQREAKSFTDCYTMIKEKTLPRPVVFCNLCASEMKACQIRYELDKESLDRGDTEAHLSLANTYKEEVQEWKRIYDKCMEDNSWTYPEERSRSWSRDYLGPEEIDLPLKHAQDEYNFAFENHEKEAEIRALAQDASMHSLVLKSMRGEFKAWVQVAFADGATYTDNYDYLREQVDRMVEQKRLFDDLCNSRVDGARISAHSSIRAIKEDNHVERKMVDFLERAITPSLRENLFVLSHTDGGTPREVFNKDMLVELEEVRAIANVMRDEHLSRSLASLSVSD